MKNDVRAVNMSFGAALNILKNGGKIARTGWNGKGMWVNLQVPDEHSKMTEPYMYLNYPVDTLTPNGRRVPWVPSVTDVLANDWYTVSTNHPLDKSSSEHHIEVHIYKLDRCEWSNTVTAMWVSREGGVVVAETIFVVGEVSTSDVERAKARVYHRLNLATTPYEGDDHE